MTTDELTSRLSEILAQEEVADADWALILSMSAQLVADMGQSPPQIATDYLSSVDRRRLDPVFAHAQRSTLAEYLRSGHRPPRKSERVGLSAEVTLRRVGKTNYRVRAFDASPHGCKLEFIDRPDIGETIWIKFEDMELLEARVCRIEGFTAGVEFQRPLHPAVFANLIKKLTGGDR